MQVGNGGENWRETVSSIPMVPAPFRDVPYLTFEFNVLPLYHTNFHLLVDVFQC